MKLDIATIEALRDALLVSGREPTPVVSSAYDVLTREGLLSPQEMDALYSVDATAETLFLMSAADDRVLEEEVLAVRGAIRALTNDVLHPKTIDVMLENYSSNLGQYGRDARLQAIGESLQRRPEEAENAFALAAAVAVADQELASQEQDLILKLASWFGIRAELAQKIISQLEAGHGLDVPVDTG